MPNQHDWHRIQHERWYRIPVQRAPEELAAEYLAFYHTRTAGIDRWAIRWYAQILRCAVVQRRELLPDEASHPRAHAYYYRFALGPLHRLPLPVPAARLRRVTFINTTFGKLITATDIRDLWQGSPTTPEVWGAGIAGLSLR